MPAPADHLAAFYDELGSRSRKARESRGMSQAALADALGVTRSSVSNLEGGRQRPPLHLLGKLAAVTGMAWTELLPDPALLDDQDSTREYRDLDERDLASVMLLRRRASGHRPA